VLRVDLRSGVLWVTFDQPERLNSFTTSDDAPSAASMGLAWKVVPDDDLARETRLAAEMLASLDPDAVAGTKRLLAHGQADLVRAAIERETAAMRSLHGGASDGPGRQDPAEPSS
jgi:enoyl-CoA hydratase/carnithine racemase